MNNKNGPRYCKNCGHGRWTHSPVTKKCLGRKVGTKRPSPCACPEWEYDPALRRKQGVVA